jgi:phage baseplate assembly protein gpV
VFDLCSKVVISIMNDGPIFSGYVVGAALEQHMGTAPELVVTVDDLGYSLAQNAIVKPWLKRKASAIITEMVPSKFSTDVTLTNDAQYENLLQRMNNLDLLDMLTRRANAVWWVDDDKLIVRDAGASTSTLTLSGGLTGTLMDFSVRASALRPADMSVKGWDPKSGQDVAGTATSDDLPTSSDFVTKFAGPPTKLAGVESSKTLSTFANPAESGEATNMAKSLLTAMNAESAVAKGTVVPGSSKVALGTKLTVNDVGPMSGTYVVSAVEHVFNKSGMSTRFVAGPVRPAGLVDTLGPARVDEGLTMPNLTTAIVSDGGDPENRGRVKVKFVGVGDNIESDWARVVTLGAGGKRGMVFQPEVGDEVLVGFERGDTRHPVVIGGLYGKTADFAADSALNDNGKVAYRRVTSRKAHILEFGDGEQPAQQHILLKLGTIGHTLRLGADEMTIDLEQGKPFTLKAGQAKIAIDNQGNINIEGMKISVKAQQDLSLEAQMNLQGKANIGVAFEGQATAELKANGQTTVQSSGQTAVKGSVVMIN